MSIAATRSRSSSGAAFVHGPNGRDSGAGCASACSCGRRRASGRRSRRWPTLAADRYVEVAFLVYPRLAVVSGLARGLRRDGPDADGARHELGRVPFVFAVFHPDAEPETDDPERLIPFLRRTPDPTFQLVRVAVLDAVRSLSSQGTQFVSLAVLRGHAVCRGAVQVPLRERIARTNLATVRRMGVDAVRRALDDIRRDRDEAYARLRARGPADLLADARSSTSKTSVEFGGMTGGKPRAP